MTVGATLRWDVHALWREMRQALALGLAAAANAPVPETTFGVFRM